MKKRAYFKQLCKKINARIPCKTQEDIDEVGRLLEEMVSLPMTPSPKIYWHRQLWIDSGFDDDACTCLLLFSGKLFVEPSDDLTEHPGITVKYNGYPKY